MTCFANTYRLNRAVQCFYTLLFLRGRQPLCGKQVVSTKRIISNPELRNARTAESLPAPGPLTLITTRLNENSSIAFFATVSAANCAAKGVPLREPLNPERPAEP